MLRPLRIEFPGACYHVICRGNARLPIFKNDVDRELLLDWTLPVAELGKRLGPVVAGGCK